MEIQAQPSSNQPEATNVSDAEKWSSLIGGGALVLLGLSQRSLRGALMALAGTGLVYHGTTGKNSLKNTVENNLNQSIRVEKTVTINRPVEELYRFWRNFENLPTFMKHLQYVRVWDDGRSHWIAKAPLGATVEWDAEIINEQENKLIAWGSVEGSDIENSGFVRFQTAPFERGTEVKVVMEYNPPGGAITATVAKLFGEEPEIQISEDLYRFKQLMETGEIASNESPSARK